MIESQAIIDTLKHAALSAADTIHAPAAHVAAEHGEKFEFGHLLAHMQNSRTLELPGGHIDLPQFPPLHVGSMTIDL